MLDKNVYNLPIDVNYIINVPTSIASSNDGQQKICDTICDCFKETSELIDTDVKKVTPAETVLEFKLRHQISVNGIDYSNANYLLIADKIQSTVGKALNKAFELDHKIMFEDVTAERPVDYHTERGFLVQLDEHNIDKFFQTPEEYGKDIDPGLAAYAGSSVFNEMRHFETDKSFFLEILEKNPFQKKYVEEKWADKNCIGKKLTGARLLRLCKENQKKLEEDFGKSYLSEHNITDELCNAALECLDIREYIPYEAENGRIELYDVQLKETSEKDISDLFYLADRIVNEFDIDFEDWNKNKTEIEYYKLFSDFLDYPYPSAFRFQSDKCFDAEIKNYKDLTVTLRMMGLYTEILPKDCTFSEMKKAVYELSKSLSDGTEKDFNKSSYKKSVYNSIYKDYFDAYKLYQLKYGSEKAFLEADVIDFGDNIYPNKREMTEYLQLKPELLEKYNSSHNEQVIINSPEKAGERFAKEVSDFARKVPFEVPQMIISEVLSKWNGEQRTYLDKYFKENNIKSVNDFNDFMKEKCGIQILSAKNTSHSKIKKEPGREGR